jgi:hypothetical protein
MRYNVHHAAAQPFHKRGVGGAGVDSDTNHHSNIVTSLHKQGLPIQHPAHWPAMSPTFRHGQPTKGINSSRPIKANTPTSHHKNTMAPCQLWHQPTSSYTHYRNSKKAAMNAAKGAMLIVSRITTGLWQQLHPPSFTALSEASKITANAARRPPCTSSRIDPASAGRHKDPSGWSNSGDPPDAPLVEMGVVMGTVCTPVVFGFWCAAVRRRVIMLSFFVCAISACCSLASWPPRCPSGSIGKLCCSAVVCPAAAGSSRVTQLWAMSPPVGLQAVALACATAMPRTFGTNGQLSTTSCAACKKNKAFSTLFKASLVQATNKFLAFATRHHAIADTAHTVKSTSWRPA